MVCYYCYCKVSSSSAFDLPATISSVEYIMSSFGLRLSTVQLVTCISVHREIKPLAFGIEVRSFRIRDVLAMTWLLLESRSIMVLLFTPLLVFTLLPCHLLLAIMFLISLIRQKVFSNVHRRSHVASIFVCNCHSPVIRVSFNTVCHFLTTTTCFKNC